MPTLKRLLRDYYREVLIHQRRGEATARSLALLIEPFERAPAHSIGADQIASRLEEIAVTAPVHAKRTLSYARGFFEWALAKEAITEVPTWHVFLDIQERARHRQLTLDEVVMIWRATEVLSERLAGAFRLMILTAAPRQQVGAMRLDELERDPASELWEWRPTALKERRGNAPAIVLPPLAQEIVDAAIIGRRPGGEFILSRTGRTALSGWSKAKRALDQQLALQSQRGQFEPWWLNDLRMSFPALAAEHAGVDPAVAEACLGRVSRFWRPDDKIWMQFSSTAKQASRALADWDAVLARELNLARRGR